MQPIIPFPISTLLASLKRGRVRAMAARAQRAQQLQLKGMSEHELKDLGIGRSEVPELLRCRPGATSGAERRPRAAMRICAG
jgi:uncharacterized protein YjiS (DUF1127 family)